MNKKEQSTIQQLKHSGNEPHLVRELIKTYQTMINSFSNTFNIPTSKLSLMRLLADSKSDIGIMDLARKLEINSAAVSRQVKDMEKEGLVKKQSDKHDGRRSYIKLTRKGLNLFKDIHNRSHDLEKIISNELGIDEMKQTANFLSKFRNILIITEGKNNENTNNF